MLENTRNLRTQVGIGTLAVFIAMVLVPRIAGGVLIETTSLLQGKSSVAGQDSAASVTDRVGVESATASYSSGSMRSIGIVLSKAPGSGDIDLSEMVVHWLGPNGSTELTSPIFSISPIRGSGTVLKDRADRMNLSKFAKTIPEGTPAMVRFITPDSGTTTVIPRTPNAPPSDGDVSLLWRSPPGNPASGYGTGIARATTTATLTPTPEGSDSNVQRGYRGLRSTPSPRNLPASYTYSRTQTSRGQPTSNGSIPAAARYWIEAPTTRVRTTTWPSTTRIAGSW